MIEILLKITFAIMFMSTFLGMLYIAAFSDRKKLKENGGYLNVMLSHGFNHSLFIDKTIESNRITQTKMILRVQRYSFYALIVLIAINALLNLIS